MCVITRSMYCGEGIFPFRPYQLYTLKRQKWTVSNKRSSVELDCNEHLCGHGKAVVKKGGQLRELGRQLPFQARVSTCRSFLEVVCVGRSQSELVTTPGFKKHFLNKLIFEAAKDDESYFSKVLDLHQNYFQSCNMV